MRPRRRRRRNNDGRDKGYRPPRSKNGRVATPPFANSWRGDVATSVAGSNHTGQAAVVVPVLWMPQRHAHFDPARQRIDLFARSRRSVGGNKVAAGNGCKILVVAVLQNGFENVSYLTH